jgi:SAM-dependent methyltransferase
MTERYMPGAQDALSRYVEQHHLARYRWAIRQLVGVQGVILDIACGAGYGSQMLADQGGRTIIGVDTSPEAVGAAAANYGAPNVSFRVGNAEDLSWIESRSVDAVVSFETIEHLHRPRRFLAEARRVLKTDGALLISTPNRLLASTLYPLRRRPNNPFHVFEYTATGFRQDLEHFFSVEQMGGQGYVKTWLAFWPVQVALKAVCHFLRRFGAYRFIDRHYHDPHDVEVVCPASGFPRATPSILVAKCAVPPK